VSWQRTRARWHGPATGPTTHFHCSAFSRGVIWCLFLVVRVGSGVRPDFGSHGRAVLCEESERFDPVQEWDRFSTRIGEVADTHASFFRVSGSTVVPVPANAGPMHKTLYAPMTQVLQNVRLVNAMDTSGCLQREKDFREFFDDFSLQLLLDDVSGGQIAAASVPAEFIVRSVRLFARALTDALDKKLLVPVVKRAKPSLPRGGAPSSCSTRFVNSDPRAPLVGLRANTGAWFETETSSSHFLLCEAEPSGSGGLRPTHDIYIGFYQLGWYEICFTKKTSLLSPLLHFSPQLRRSACSLAPLAPLARSVPASLPPALEAPVPSLARPILLNVSPREARREAPSAACLPHGSRGYCQNQCLWCGNS
jgi:hypothetical protein